VFASSERLRWCYAGEATRRRSETAIGPDCGCGSLLTAIWSGSGSHPTLAGRICYASESGYVSVNMIFDGEETGIEIEKAEMKCGRRIFCREWYRVSSLLVFPDSFWVSDAVAVPCESRDLGSVARLPR